MNNSTEGREERTSAGNSISITNADFMAEVFHKLPDRALSAVCSKSGDPTTGGWQAIRWDPSNETLDVNRNNYFNYGSFKLGSDGEFNVRKENFAALHCVVLDDVGTKIPTETLSEITSSWRLETSPGNYQVGFILTDPVTDLAAVTQLQKAIIAKGLSDPGTTGPSHYVRLPVAINGKQKYATAGGQPFNCRLTEWRPEVHFSVERLVESLGLELEPAELQPSDEQGGVFIANDVLIPSALENPIITALKSRSLYKTPLGEGKHDITCPWLEEHTDAIDSGTAYFEPDDQYSVGGFSCLHSHRARYGIKQLVERLEVSMYVAKNKSRIRVTNGELHSVVQAAEKVLAYRGRHYQYGGLIVSVSTDPATGNPSIKETKIAALTKELSRATNWEKPSGNAGIFVPCDPPSRHVSILADSQHYDHLPVLGGLARHPHYRESDGCLVTQSGYDPQSKIFGVFDAKEFPIAEPTLSAAREALEQLEDLLDEFHFVDRTDKSVALSAIFTATTRPSYALAPGYHTKAATFGSGKSYLCETIGYFAGPDGTEKVSYPKTSEEATKVILALLMKGPAGIEFDDMDTDWIPHGVINRMMTSPKITDRILGVSKTATVSTRTLILGSGNNVGPVRDLLRRVLTIRIDARCANPAMLTYTKRPAEMVRQNRGKYVACVLTIIRAWQAAGSPREGAGNIASYGGAWSDYCRYPLTWLGLPDPVTSLLDQIRHDPDAEALGNLMTAWLAEFGNAPTTVRRAVERASADDSNDLIDAIREFPIEERGSINNSKFGWFLKKNANRVVNGHAFQKATADGRVAWQVLPVKSPNATPEIKDSEFSGVGDPQSSNDSPEGPEASDSGDSSAADFLSDGTY
ncbi:MAG: hypothetical protein Q7U82_00770 [Gammaproteobacteria bacterium]|nr:hypothetical protein [Gammaproteobacteria bacterium]